MFQSNPIELAWLLFQLVVMSSVAYATGASIISIVRNWSGKLDQKAAIRQELRNKRAGSVRAYHRSN